MQYTFRGINSFQSQNQIERRSYGFYKLPFMDKQQKLEEKKSKLEKCGQ